MKTIKLNKIHSIFILLIVVSFSCNENVTYKDTDSFSAKDFRESKNLIGERIDFDEPVMKPMRAYVIDSFLTLINIQTEYFISRYNLKTLKKTGDFLSFGSGPEEMISPIKIFSDGSTIKILDGGKRSLFTYDKKSFCQDNHPTSLDIIKFNNFIEDIVILNDKRLVTPLRSPDHLRLSFFNTKGEFMETKGDYPFINNKKLDTIEKLASYVCNIAINQSKDKILITYKQTDLIEIYDIKGNLIVRKHGPDHFFPHIKKKQIGENTAIHSTPGESRDGYFSPTVYKEQIYVLYSGQIYNPNKPNLTYDQLYVFDWDGNPICRYKLNIPIYSFTIDSQTGTLYGLTDEPDFQVVKYKI